MGINTQSGRRLYLVVVASHSVVWFPGLGSSLGDCLLGIADGYFVVPSVPITVAGPRRILTGFPITAEMVNMILFRKVNSVKGWNFEIIRLRNLEFAVAPLRSRFGWIKFLETKFFPRVAPFCSCITVVFVYQPPQSKLDGWHPSVFRRVVL